MNTIVSPKMSRGQGNELLNALEAAGLVSALAQKVVGSKDNELAKKVVQFIQNGAFTPSTSQGRARAIMGQNFFGIEEAIKHFGINPANRKLAYLAEVPWSEEVLAVCKDTHILVAVFPLSILDVRGHCRDQHLFLNQDWYDSQEFAKDKGKFGWQLVRKTPVTDSTNKNWIEQQVLLSKDEETPTTQVMTYAIIGHFKATSERLFEHNYVRCADLDSDGNCVYVGRFDSVGFNGSLLLGRQPLQRLRIVGGKEAVSLELLKF